MNQSYSYFYFDLKLKSPSDSALENGLDDFAEDTYDAAEFFNNRFKGIKKITILEVEGVALRLMLVYERSTPDKVTAKELTIFSRFLYNERSWDRFTKEPSKLFIPTKIVPMEWHEAHFTITADFERDLEDEKIKRWPSLWPDWAGFDFDPDYEGLNTATVSCDEDDDISYEDELTDDQLLAVLNSVLLTQNLGSSEAKEAKRSTIKQIKKLITPWAIYG
ncbi:MULTISPECIES: hypothetical protein [Brevibacillus]|uniref:hypothetical protein n=1 Tax=Brevibacillus TaxID=55080 RepID=UPI0002A51F04|nr:MULTISPECIES: hypothetical protein [Brevibacillus]ELK41166.1 hypothetical protein D478_15285 [Brevibacillus agri BAB-2500]MDN4095622.1 hypothetical protein [Brevibacillus agri]MDR9507010.1 hypothetical protein [Brevibacillus agri]WNF05556.1 hypothetical protein RFB14_25045 [Brevibacillus borstelensis]